MHRGSHMVMRSMLTSVFALTGALTLAYAGTPVPQAACKPISAPKDTQLSIVAPRIVTDDIPMTIVSARSALSPTQFAAYYKKLWQGPGAHPLYVENRIGKWDVVAHKQGKCMYTVQIQHGISHTEALLGIGEPGSKVSVRKALDFPSPGDAHPLTHMVSEDSGTLGDTWLLYTRNSAASTVRFYSTTLPQLGWQPLMKSAHSKMSSGTLLMYRNGGRNVGIVVQPFQRGSAITLTVMER